MKLRTLASAVCITALATAPVFADVLFSSDMSTSDGWGVMTLTDDDFATFGYDYSAMNIPMAPGASDTLGLHMAANTIESPGRGAVTVYTQQTFSGIYQVSFDAWGNFAGPAPGGGTGSTEMFGGGIGHDQTTVQQPLIPGGSGAWLAMSTDGYFSRDYRLYKDDGEQWIASGQYNVESNDSADPAFATIAPPVDISTVNPAPQTGVTDAGQAAFHWHHVVLTVLPDEGDYGHVIVDIDGFELGVIGRAGSEFPVEGAVSLFHSDYYNSVANEFGFSIFDNVLVTDVPEPAGLALLGLGALALIRRR